jgi:hypothetical protein
MEAPLADSKPDTLRRPCQGCGAPILFVHDEKGKTHPLDITSPVYTVQQDLTGTWRATRVDAYVSHFKTCPKANQFSASQKGPRP